MRILFVVALLSLAACKRSQPEAPAQSPLMIAQQTRAKQTAQLPESTQRHWAFLNRIRQDDTLNSSISRTLVNDENQLGVVLFSSVTPGTVPALMHTVLTQMAQKFPGEDVVLVVYASATPLRKIGVAHLDGKTEAITYTPL
jgi:hypothetical protein